MRLFYWSRVVLLASGLLSLLSACGGGGNGAPSNETEGTGGALLTDVGTIAVSVSYPTPGAHLGGEVTNTVVTGRVTDSDGAPINIDFIDINGTRATVSLKDATRWSARVPVTKGQNTLNINAKSVRGASFSTTLTVNNQPALDSPGTAQLDSARNRLLLFDQGINALLAVDLGNGSRSIISAADVGLGPAFGLIRDIALDTANNRVLAIDVGLKALLSVDLDNGNRSILSSAALIGSGPDFGAAQAMVLDATNNRALVISTVPAKQLIAVDLSTGNRTAISRVNDITTTLEAIGSGVSFGAPRGMALDSNNNRVLVVDILNESLMAVDLSNGNRSRVSDTVTGNGVDLITPRRVVLNTATNRAVILDTALKAIVLVDLSTGDRTILTSKPELEQGRDIVLDSNNARVLVTNNDLDSLFSSNLIDNALITVSDNSVGNGLPMSIPRAAVLDTDNNRLLFPEQDLSRPAVVAVNINNGNRTVLSNVDTGSGPNLSLQCCVVLDARRNRLLTVDVINQSLLAVDLDSGNRTILSSATRGTGTPITLPSQIMLDSANGRALIVTGINQLLLAVDLRTGNRGKLFELLPGMEHMVLDAANNRVLTFVEIDNGLLPPTFDLVALDLDNGLQTVISTRGSAGPDFSNPSGLAFDTTNNKVLVSDQGLQALISVDLRSGARTIVSDASQGGGPNFGTPLSAALDVDNKRAFIVDAAGAGGKLLAVELESGERAVVSQ